MTDFHRYGVYYAPPAGSALARLGADWLGWDAEAGRKATHPDLPGLPRPAAALTETARKYGVHATLKPPFRLPDWRSPEQLHLALDTVAQGIAPFEVPCVAVGLLGRFAALLPAAPCPRLDALAAATVEALDDFRAPPDAAERARRGKPGLSARQQALLDRWGYPYVMDEFRFHMTLTGPLDDDEAAPVTAALTAYFAPALATALPVREVCLFGEDTAGRFHLVRRVPLGG